MSVIKLPHWSHKETKPRVLLKPAWALSQLVSSNALKWNPIPQDLLR